MPFIWTNQPNLPPVIPAPEWAPNAVSTQVHVVANTVNVTPIICTLSYNTHNIGYDVICELPTLNVKDLHVTHLEADNITVRFATTINTANIGRATINTANIVNATIANGRMGVNPSSNLQIATKEYVDALAANSTPLGGNLQLLIQAAGDLLVGVSDNTAERLPIGTVEGGVLIAGGSSNTGVRWANARMGVTGTHRDLVIGTSRQGTLRNTHIQLVTVSEIVMDDGERISAGWNGLQVSLASNVSTSGIGFLDTGVALPNTCYEIYAIRNSTTNAQALLMHRALDRDPDIHLPASLSTGKRLNYRYGTGRAHSTMVALNFFPNKTGPLVGVDLAFQRIGLPVGNVWVTLEADDGTTNASGIILATSRYIRAERIPSPGLRQRMVFDNPATISAANSYWCVIRSDCPTITSPESTYIHCMGDGTTTYPGRVKFFNANTGGWAMSNSAFSADLDTGPPQLYFRSFIEANNTAVVMPSGYDQKCLLSYCFTTHHGLLKEYYQRDRKMSMPYFFYWQFLQGSTYGTQYQTGANNAPAGVTVTSTHMGGYIPPVPCLAWIILYSGFSGTGGICAIGNLQSTDAGGGTAQIAYESVGHLTANCLGTGSAPNMLGPVFVEQQCIQTLAAGGTIPQIYVGGVEF